MYNFNLPPDMCAADLGHALDTKTTKDAIDTLAGQNLVEPIRALRQGEDVVGQCTVKNCVAIVQLTLLGDRVALSDLGKSLSGCVEPA